MRTRSLYILLLLYMCGIMHSARQSIRCVVGGGGLHAAELWPRKDILYYDIFLLRRRTGERVCVCERTCAYGAHEWAARGHFVRPRVICVLASAHTQPLQLGMRLCCIICETLYTLPNRKAKINITYITQNSVRTSNAKKDIFATTDVTMCVDSR